MKKKLLSTFLSLCIISVLLAAVPDVSFAETEGIYTYYLDSDNLATIYICDTSASGDIIIPPTLGGYPVTSIMQTAFRDCSNITRIEIPDGIMNIYKETFANCTGLKSIKIPDSVISIGDGAFRDCQSLESIKIPKGVTYIEENAFNGCQSLKSVEIPNGVTYIEENAFNGCQSLESIKIPNGVTTIGSGVFSGCTNLENIEIADSVTRIGYTAFLGTKYYKTPENWENDVLYIGKHLIKAKENISGNYSIKSGTLSIAETAFEDCKSLESVDIPEGIKVLGYAVFSGCFGLKSVKIPNGVESIEQRAFTRSLRLENIELPDSVINIGEYAFDSTKYYNTDENWENGVLYIGKHLIKAKSTLSGIYDVKSETLTIADKAFSYCKNLSGVYLPDSVINIGEEAFYECENLKNLEMPGTVENLGTLAFYGCTNFESINVYGYKTNFCSENGVLFNNNKTELVCYPAGKIDTFYKIPDSVTLIADYAFFDCKGIKNIEMPSHITRVGICAFEGCGVTNINYLGGRAQWNKMYIESGNVNFKCAKINFRPAIGSISAEKISGGVKVNIEVTDILENDFVFIASYGENGRFSGFKKVKVTDGVGNTTFYDNNATTFRVFVWDSGFGNLINDEEFLIQ